MLEVNAISDKKREFLDKFTEELIITTAMLMKERERFEKELARAKRAIATEKLKQKFSKYGEKKIKKQEKKEEEKPAVQPLIIRPAPHPAMLQKRPMIQPRPRVIQKPAEIPVKKEITPAKPAEALKKPEEMPITNIPIPPKQPLPGQGEINFGRIMFLIRDPAVTYIECPGIDKNIIIKRAGMTLRTQIKLTKDEILTLIKAFSETARIPLIEGLLTARIQNLEISAVVTEKGVPSFIIRKILIEIKPLAPSILATSTMPGAIALSPPPKQIASMPPVQRPFTPGSISAHQMPIQPRPLPTQTQKPEEKKTGFWNKKLTIGR